MYSFYLADLELAEKQHLEC